MYCRTKLHVFKESNRLLAALPSGQLKTVTLLRTSSMNNFIFKNTMFNHMGLFISEDSEGPV